MHESPLDRSVTSVHALKAQPQSVALFISDLHLHETLPRTSAAFFKFLTGPALTTQALYLMGDLFEYWAGDDDIDSGYNRQVVSALRSVSDAGIKLFWIPGNRDFLVGEAFATASGATILSDPFVATIADQRILLTHGDAQCTDDTAYMAFRKQVRQPGWQESFLSMPLVQRKAMIEGMRKESRAAQSTKSYDIMDVNDEAIANLFSTSSVNLMIHGHTHRPARHEKQYAGTTCVRHVLPDWDCDHEPFRGGWLSIDQDGQFHRHELAELDVAG